MLPIFYATSTQGLELRCVQLRYGLMETSGDAAADALTTDDSTHNNGEKISQKNSFDKNNVAMKM